MWRPRSLVEMVRGPSLPSAMSVAGNERQRRLPISRTGTEDGSMIASIAATKPQPLPATGDPRTWSGIPLATLNLTGPWGADGAQKTAEIDVTTGGNITDILKRQPQFIPAGRNYKAAVNEAIVHANESDKQQTAAAVMQAASGEYFVTHIGTMSGGSMRWQGDSYGWDKVHLNEATRLTDDLKALVGERSWVDFTGDAPKVEFPDSARPQS